MTLTDTPLVSVILVTYNSAQYVTDTLNSIKAQTWKNIELIITDDASRDNTVQVCADWLVKNNDCFPSTKLFTVAQNTGIPSNCNRGLQSAKGEWIKIIGGDDILMENAIVDNLMYAKQFPDASFIISDVQEIDESGVLNSKNITNDALIFFSNLPSVKRQLKDYSRWPAFLNTPTFFYQRSVLEKINYFDEEFKIYEDIITLIRVLENNIKLHYMRIPTVAYRIHQKGVSRNPLLDEIREKESFQVFKKYRKPHLNPFNPIDLSVHYESWLRFKYKGFNGRKGIAFLHKFSLFYWYLRANGVKSY